MLTIPVVLHCMNQPPVRHWIHLSFLLWIFSACSQESSVVLFCNNMVNKDALNGYCMPSVVVEDLTYESDVLFESEEFLHLVGFQSGGVITSADIYNAVERFVKKNKFLTIKMNIFIAEDGVRLHFVFEGMWTFRKVKIHHVYQKKHLLARVYLMERGELFDEAKHDHSVANIKKLLTDRGYLDHQVTSEFEYDHRTKEVVVHITVKKGRSYGFGSLAIDIACDQDVNQDADDLSRTLRRKFLQPLSAQTFTKKLLNKHVKLLKNYLAKKGFLYSSFEMQEHIDHKHRVVDLSIKCTIHQKREIVFFGNRFFSKKELLDKILDFGQSVWLLPASLLAEEVVREYKNKGFLGVEVTTQEEKERSFFIIKEGQRVHLVDVEIKNAPHIDLASVKKQCFSSLLKNSYYDAQLCDEAVALLRQFYIDQGFLTVVIVDYKTIATDGDNKHHLVITVDEGAKKYIKEVTVEGYPELSMDNAFTMYTNKNEPLLFQVKLLEHQRNWLLKYFQSLGYANPRLKPTIDSHDNEVTIAWTVDAGEKVCFGKTIIQGSSSFPFSSIKHFLAYEEGELWDQAKIKQSFMALKDLEIFETIHFLPDYTAPTEKKPIYATLHLDDRYEIRTRAGLELQHVRKYQTFSGLTYKLGGTALIKNPTNAADQLRFDCDFARSHREIVGKYRRPWLTKHPFFTTFQVYSIMYDQPGFRVDSSINDVYTVLQNGFLVQIQKKTDHIDWGWNNGCEWMKLHIGADEEHLSFAHAIDFEPRLIDKMVPFFFTEPTIVLERIDNALNPTQGGIGLFSFKAMIPLMHKYKDSLFFKILFEQSVFAPIRSVVAALRFRCGHIFYREFSGIMPSERFYLGGSHSLRGYEADLAPPLGVFVDDDGKHHVVPKGGRTMVNMNAELRFPIWRKIGGVIFQDLGALSGTMFADFRTQDLLAATGFGLRIFTPLGPLRFDIGWRWRKQLPIERSFAWFLTFGQAF